MGTKTELEKILDEKERELEKDVNRSFKLLLDDMRIKSYLGAALDAKDFFKYAAQLSLVRNIKYRLKTGEML